MTTVLVVEDHAFVRQSLVKTISAEEPFTVVGEAGEAGTAVALAKKTQPDVVLLDVGLPGADGLECAARIRRQAPDQRIILLTMHEDDATIRAAVSIGINGYIPKSASTDELLSALRMVAEGGTYLSPPIARRVMELAGGRASGVAGHLTDRELEIVRLMAKGHTAREVADHLYVSLKTVKNHLTKIYAKLDVRSGAQAVAKAYQQGLASHPDRRTA